MSDRDFLVIGGGIGGMSAAIALGDRGLRVDLVEVDPEWRVYGAGITVTGPTYRALAMLGLLDQVLATGYHCRGDTRICDADGTVIAEVPTAPLEDGLPPLGGIMRPALHDILAKRTLAAGIDVKLGVTARAWRDDGNTVEVGFTDDSVRTYGGVIIADGAFSENRSRLFPHVPDPQFTGQYCWRIVAERPAAIDRGYIFSAGRVFAGLIPTSTTRMYMWLLEPQASKARIDPAEQVPRLREIMAPFGGLLGQLREGLTADSAINLRPLDAVILPPPWHVGRIILIGDAAHSTTPHLASGAGIAIEDGVVLAQLLSEGGTVADIFARFTALRFERCRDVVESSVEIGALQQQGASPDKVGRLIGAAERRLRSGIWEAYPNPATGDEREELR